MTKNSPIPTYLYFTLSEGATAPKHMSAEAAGFDLSAVSRADTDTYIEYDTGVSFAIPEGFVGLVMPRSSVSQRHLSLANSVGVIDSDYRGTVKLRYYGDPANAYKPGDRVGQIIFVPVPKVALVHADKLDDTKRSTGGFGSTGA